MVHTLWQCLCPHEAWMPTPPLVLCRHAVMVAIDAMGRRDLQLWPDWYQGVHWHRHRSSDGEQFTPQLVVLHPCCVDPADES
jgi:hypothetical protein